MHQEKTKKCQKKAENHPNTLQRLARRGDVCGVHVGKLWRFRVSALNAWLSRITD